MCTHLFICTIPAAHNHITSDLSSFLFGNVALMQLFHFIASRNESPTSVPYLPLNSCKMYVHEIHWKIYQESGAQIAVMRTSKNISPACLTCPAANQPANCIRGQQRVLERETEGKEYNCGDRIEKSLRMALLRKTKETGTVPSAKLMAGQVLLRRE